MPRKLYSVTLYANEKPMFKISYRSDGPFVTELLQSDNAHAVAFMNLLPLEVHCLPLGNTLILTNFNDETSVRLLLRKLCKYTNARGTGGDIATEFINHHKQSAHDEREKHDLEDLLMKLNFPRDLAIPTMSSLRDLPASELVASTELSTESLVVNPDQIINNKSDLQAPTLVTFQYQAVPATSTISSLQDMSVADLVASTGLSTELMAMNIRENVRKEHIHDSNEMPDGTEVFRDELQLALKTPCNGEIQPEKPTSANHTAFTYLPARTNVNALSGNIMKSSDHKSTLNN